MTNRFIHGALLAITILFISTTGATDRTGSSTAKKNAHRPTIGLALSGGAARGSAHIGVLKVLEELRIPIDYIAGTSMGAIVSGLYASGLSPDEIAQVAITMDWEDVFNDFPPRKSLSFRRKQDVVNSLMGLEIGVKKGKFVLPRGLVTGQKLRFALRSLTFPVRNIKNFDDLPIPFRAVATDILTGDRVVIDSGEIVDAIHASMAIPGVFSPVEIGNHLLVDGGVVSQLPVEAVKNMGADIVIAVDVGSELAKKEELESLSGLSFQLMDVIIRSNLNREALLADTVIHCELEKYKSSDFQSVAKIIDLGEKSARTYIPELAKLSVKNDEYSRFLAKHRHSEPKSVDIDFLQIDNLLRVDPRIITNRIRIRPNESLDLKILKQDIDSVFELGDFDRVDYSFIDSDSGEGLRISATEKSIGPNSLRFGLSFTDDAENNSFFNILLRYTMTRLNRLGAEWQSEVQFGRTRRIFTEFYQPLTFSGTWFMAPKFQYINNISNLYQDDVRVAAYQNSIFSGGGDLGYQMGNYGEARLGYLVSNAQADLTTGFSDTPYYDITATGITMNLVFDRIDNPGFPRDASFTQIKGFFARDEFGSDDTYTRLEGFTSKFISSNRHTYFGMLDVGTSFGTDLPIYDQFAIGGLFSFSGYQDEQLRGNYYGIARVGYYNRVMNLPVAVGGGLYIGAWIEGGSAVQSIDDIELDSLNASLTLAMGLDTILGPIYLAYGQTDSGNGSFYLTLGKSF